MDKKSALITGGAGSLGLEIAKQLVKKGCNLIILDQDAEAIDRIKKDFGDAIMAYEGDASDLTLVERIAHELKEKQKTISYLVNTTADNPHKLFKDMAIEEMQKIVEGTLLSHIYTIRSFWDLFEDGGGIVNISSVHGTTTKKGNSIYAAGKAGVESLTRALAAELREKNIRINAVAPGGFTSEFYISHYSDWQEKLNKGQIFTPEDMANVVMFLLSDEAKAVNGETIIADGGVFTVRANSSDW